MKRKRFLNVIWGFGIVFNLLAVINLGVAESAEDAFPNRNISVVVPFPPGGLVDLAGRILAEEFSRNVGASVVIINKSGGGGAVGWKEVMQSKPDGYMLALIPNSLVLIGSHRSPDVIKLSDATFIARFVSTPNLLLVRKESPFKTFEDLIDAAKKNPGKLAGSGGAVTFGGYFTFQLICQEAGVNIRHVPMQGGAPTITALLGGHLDVGVVATNAVVGLLKAGDLRALVSSSVKLPEFPDIPTIGEKGYPNAAFGLWVGMVGPKGMEKSVVDKISKAFDKSIRNPAVIKKFEETGMQFDYLGGQEFVEEIIRDAAKIGKVIEKSK
jgi:tripartite-type tricarboxylate transporter receptor subunit TctC